MSRKTTTSWEVKEKWNSKNYDRITFHCQKGGSSAITRLAELEGLSKAEYLRHLAIADAHAKKRPDLAAEIGGGGANS